MDSIQRRLADIRDRAMTYESLDMRQEVADLCDAVGEIVARLDKAEEKARGAVYKG